MDKKNIVEVTNIVLNEMDKRYKHKQEQTPFQKTERLLYNYTRFKEVIKDKHEEIQEVQEYGLKKKAKSIIPIVEGAKINYVELEEEKINRKVEDIKASIKYTQDCIKTIDKALSKIKKDKYYDIISMKYFESMTLESIAEELQCDVGTVSRNRKRLVNDLSVYLLSDEIVYNILR